MTDAGTTSRRSFLRAAGATGLTGAVSVSGCLDILFGSGAGGTVPGGSIPSRQDITPDDADVYVESVDQLIEEANQQDGRIIWIPSEIELDLTGRGLHLENVTLASGRSEGQTGARIISDDQGQQAPTWAGGSNEYGLISLGEHARLTGLEVRGPHHSMAEHPAIPSYIPFAPQSSRSARDCWRAERYARGVTIIGNSVTVDNCEIWAFATQAISVGTDSDTPENTVIAFCHLHNALMTSLGYGVDVRHGHPQIHRVYFDACRHCVNGSGMGDAGYYVTESTFGPWVTSHPIDMHGVYENVSGSGSPEDRNYRWRAGGTMVVRDSVVIPTHVPDLPFINHNRGGQTPHVHIRAVPEDGFYFLNNQCAHTNPDVALQQSSINGIYTPDERGFRNVFYEDNSWDVEFKPPQARGISN